ncbi:MAG: hypothetical protein J0L51_07050 [Rhizobiales bacterium]|nr:hypothetical protein [Hyphomicrobiales bacterium]
MQTRRASLVEAVVNVAVGFWVAVGVQALVFPLFGIATSSGTELSIAAIFTAVSIARSYLMRRLFERLNAH